MKQFFWKIVLCLVPCLLAGWVTTDAMVKYQAGEPGGFKLGVDLVGGTILVYEIDLRKQQEQDKDSKGEPFNINVLAESLKRRIDPNDIFNIVIRPAGGEGRVEIILPTGGTHRTKKAEEAWQDLLTKIEDKYQGVGKLDVPRGKVLELADRVQGALSKKKWESVLFTSKAAWDRLIHRAVNLESPDP